MIRWLADAVNQQSPSPLEDPVTYLVGLGPTGVIIALFVMGRLRTKSEVDGLLTVIKDQADALSTKGEENRLLQQVVLDRVVPAAEKATIAIQLAATESGKGAERAERILSAIAEVRLFISDQNGRRTG